MGAPIVVNTVKVQGTVTSNVGSGTIPVSGTVTAVNTNTTANYVQGTVTTTNTNTTALFVQGTTVATIANNAPAYIAGTATVTNANTGALFVQGTTTATIPNTAPAYIAGTAVVSNAAAGALFIQGTTNITNVAANAIYAQGTLLVENLSGQTLTQGAVSPTTSATQILAIVSSSPWRRAVTIVNKGTAICYIGASNVTTTTGVPLAQNASITLTEAANAAIYGRVANGTGTVVYLAESD
jgi:hypothetical protein